MKRSKNKPTQSTKLYGRQLCGRSRITNGSQLMPEIDGRSIWARRLRDLIHLHTSDLGGLDNLSQAEQSLIRRTACITVELEHMEQKFAMQANGASFDQLRIYQMTVNTLRRLLETLGLERRAKDITPDPLSYARQYARRKAEEAEDAEVA
jgi:hypothetical protein